MKLRAISLSGLFSAVSAATIYISASGLRIQPSAQRDRPPGASAKPTAPPAIRSDSVPTKVTRPAQANPDILAALQSDDDTLVCIALEKDLPAWIVSNPVTVAQALTLTIAGRHRELILRRVAELWSVRQPEQALAWASSLPDDLEREAITGEVCRTIGRNNPQRALALAADKLTGGRLEVVRNIVDDWAGRDASSAVNWALSQATDSQRDQLIADLMTRQARFHPRQAATMIVDEIQPGEIRNEAILSVVHQWALQDTASAQAWVNSFPPGNPLTEKAKLEVRNLGAFR